MGKVNCVLGRIDDSALGEVLMHEHIMVADHSMRKAFHDWVEEEEFLTLAVRFLARAKRGGICSLVDSTAINLGRDIDIIRRVSEMAEINVIAATGFFDFDSPWLADKEPEWLADKLIREIEYGIAGTSCKAGVIKCASPAEGISPTNRKLLKVACIAHKATGVPITTHSPPAYGVGLAQTDIFEEEGVDLKKVLIGHTGDSADLNYIEALLSKGCMIGMDRFGQDGFLAEADRVSVVKTLADRGYASRMTLSADFAAFLDYRLAEAGTACEGCWDSWKRMPMDDMYWQYSSVKDMAVPDLLAAGVTRAQIDEMLIENPRRFLSG